MKESLKAVADRLVAMGWADKTGLVAELRMMVDEYVDDDIADVFKAFGSQYV